MSKPSEQALELPDLAPGLRWSPDPEINEHKPKASRGHNIVSQVPGYYRIDETCNSPITSIGKDLRSGFGMAINEEFKQSKIHGQALDQIDLRADSGDEGMDEECIDGEHTWIPYQELGASSTQKHASTSLSKSPGRSKHYQDMTLGPEPPSFTYATPTEVFSYTIAGVREYHAERYKETLKFVELSGFDPVKMLRPRALEVLLSGVYSRNR